MSDDEEDDRPRRSGGPRLRRVARRLFRELDGGEDDDDAAEGTARPEGGRSVDPWALLGAALETGDKAKTEMVRMLAREVRSYLEALEVHKDLHHLITHYSLEVHASVHLKPLDPDAPPAPSAAVSLRPKAEPAPAEAAADPESVE